MTTTPSSVVQFRDQMTRRWERSCRRRQQMWDAMYHDDTAVGDDLAAMVAELKQVMYDFCRYAKQQGLSKPATSDSGYDLINRWRASHLSGQENAAWEQIDQIRNFEVHTRPADTRVKEINRTTRETPRGTIHSIEEEYVVTVEEGGVPADVPLLMFSQSSIEAVRAFIKAFDTIR